MGDLVEEELEFRGGTLQLSTDGSGDGAQLVTSRTHPSVLSGADSISSESLSERATNDNRRNESQEPVRTVYPRYDMPFSSENIKDFFSYRDGIVDAAVQECITGLIFPESDGDLIGSWLLTEITLWDNEKEKLLLLTTKMVMIIKYDFIAMKKLDLKKIYLSDLDTIVIGELSYPPASFVPRLNGIATGVSTVVRDCIIDRLVKARPCGDNAECKPFDPKYFEPRERNLRGIRLMWNKGQPLSARSMWNPFSQDTPFATFASHPVYWHKEANTMTERSIYDMESFADQVTRAVEALGGGCCVHHAPIVIQSYVGVASMLHNKNSLGFFKVRGKFSF